VQVFEAQLKDLHDRGVVEKSELGELRLTAFGLEMGSRLMEARRMGLTDVLARWEPEKHPDVLALLNRLAETLVRDLPVPSAP
jgi:hypothetical protein